MELLIAVLVAFGVITTRDTSNIDQATIDKLIKENNITQSQIDAEAKIIGLEETDY